MASTLVSCFATWQNFESTVKQQEIKQNKLCCKRSGIKGTSWRNQSAAKTCRKVSLTAAFRDGAELGLRASAE